MTNIQMPGTKANPRADLALANADAGNQLIVATSQKWDDEQSAAAEADYQAKVKRNADRAEITALIAQIKRGFSDPLHTKQSRARDEAQIKALEAKLARLDKAAAQSKKRAEIRARKATSQMMAFLAKTSARPHILQEIEIPKALAKLDPLAAVAKVRADLAALDDKESAIHAAYLPLEDAKDRAMAAIRRQSARFKAIPVGELAMVRRHDSGDPYLAPIEIPADAFWHAIEPLTLAAFEDRLEKLYDKLSFEDGAMFLSMADRKKALRELKEERDRLELIEGALIRRAYLAGHEIPVRPDMDVKNLFAMVPDPSWTKPQQWEDRTTGGGLASHNAF